MSNYILNTAMVITTMWVVRRFWSIFYEKKKTSIFNCNDMDNLWIISGIFAHKTERCKYIDDNL